MKEIVKAITPQHIYDIPLLKDGLDIFISFLMENSDITEDIKKIYDSTKKPIYEEWLKIYLENIYKMLNKSTRDEVLYNKLSRLYTLAGHNPDEIEADMKINVLDILSKDYLYTNKDFKSSKGTAKAIEYIYNIVSKADIQKKFLGGGDYNFVFRDTDHLFEYEVEGNMIKEIFEYYVKPLTHPVGWSHVYKHIMYLSFTDYFDIDFTFDVRAIEVRCMNGDNLSHDNYFKNISHDGKPLVQNNNVTFITTESVSTGYNKVSIRHTVYFKSGEILISNENPRSITLYNEDGTVKIDYNSLSGNCGLFLDYDTKTNTTVTDEIDFGYEFSLASTTGKQNIIGAGNMFVGAFLVGDELVNKNVPVTYDSITGNKDGTNYSDIYTIGGDDECPLYWDMAASFDSIMYFDGCKRFFDRHKYDGVYWDKGETFDNFMFGGYEYTRDELNLLMNNNVSTNTVNYINNFDTDIRFNNFIWDDVNHNKILYGYTARDEFTIETI